MLARCETVESCGLAEEPFRRCIVDAVEAGEAACEAKVSTCSIECDCHPWLTLTMAYDRRAFSSADSW